MEPDCYHFWWPVGYWAIGLIRGILRGLVTVLWRLEGLCPWLGLWWVPVPDFSPSISQGFSSLLRVDIWLCFHLNIRLFNSKVRFKEAEFQEPILWFWARNWLKGKFSVKLSLKWWDLLLLRVLFLGKIKLSTSFFKLLIMVSICKK